jgi:prepilin-type N-terminal cleavage/methylation domain-containing protein
MKYIKKGFSLIELLIGIAIGSMIASILLTALYQGSRFQKTVDTVFDSSVRVAIVTNQLEKDFMGAFIPVQARIKQSDEEQEDEDPAQKKESAVVKKETPSGKKDTQQVDRPAEKPLEKIFYSTNKGTNLATLTFITNNPIAVFVGKDVGVMKPKIVRVQYTLVPDKEKKDTFRLIRQEGVELDLANFGKPRSYELLDAIKEFSVTYTARIEKKEENKQNMREDKQATATSQKVLYEYKTMPEWVSEPAQDAQKPPTEENQQMPRIPYSVTIKIVLWNKKQAEETYIVSYEIPVDTSEPQQKEKTGARKEKRSEQSSKEVGKTTADKKVVENKQQDTFESLSITMGNVTKLLSRL